MEHPALPASVVVLPGTPVEEAWEQFLVFEALHHQMDIMNPLSSEELDRVLATLPIAAGDRVLDIGCGHGESLLRIAGRHRIDGVGVDLSPWQIRRAAERSAARPLPGTLTWWLGRGEDTPADPVWDVVACLGASWIWDGFEGTARALASRCRDGGHFVLADIQMRPGVTGADLSADLGSALGRADQVLALERLGCRIVAEVVPGAASWDAYQDRIRASAEAYALVHPGEQSEGFLREQQRWAREHADIAGLLAWTVWICRVGPASPVPAG